MKSSVSRGFWICPIPTLHAYLLGRSVPADAAIAAPRRAHPRQPSSFGLGPRACSRLWWVALHVLLRRDAVRCSVAPCLARRCSPSLAVVVHALARRPRCAPRPRRDRANGRVCAVPEWHRARGRARRTDARVPVLGQARLGAGAVAARHIAARRSDSARRVAAVARAPRSRARR